MIAQVNRRRHFAEEQSAPGSYFFSGSLDEKVLSGISKKLKFITGKTPPSHIYIIVTDNGMDLLFETVNKSRVLKMSVSKSHFSKFVLQKEPRYNTADGLRGHVCCVDYFSLQQVIRKEELQNNIILTEQAVIIDHSDNTQTKIQVLTTIPINDFKSVPSAVSRKEQPVASCTFLGSLQPIRTLQFVGALRSVKIRIANHNSLTFEREDPKAAATVTVKDLKGELSKDQSFLWVDLLFLISLARASDKSEIKLRFMNNCLEAQTKLDEVNYFLTIAMAAER